MSGHRPKSLHTAPAVGSFGGNEWAVQRLVLLCLKSTFMEALAEDLDIGRSSVELLPQLAMPDQTLHDFVRSLQSEVSQSGLGSALMV